MDENDRSREPKPPDKLTWAKFIAGIMMVVFMVLIHAYVKELPLWLFSIPAFLMGFDPTRFFKPK